MPYIGDGYLKIFSNDGSTELAYFVATIAVNGSNTGAVTYGGATINASAPTLHYYSYSGNLKFIGFATEPNATEPTYKIGDTFTWADDASGNYGDCVLNLYIIESLEGSTWYVPSGWKCEAGYGRFAINCYNTVLSDVTASIALGYNFFAEPGTEDGFIPYKDSICFDAAGYYGPFNITIIGGTDVTNPKLIAWLSEYGELQASFNVTEFDLSTVGLSAGTHTITARSKASGYNTSTESNAVSYVVEGEETYTIEANNYAITLSQYELGVPNPNIVHSASQDMVFHEINGRYSWTRMEMKAHGQGWFELFYDDTLVCSIEDSVITWLGYDYVYIWIESNQAVSKEFYDWFMANAEITNN